jgi:phenylalanyl-tRNA synthetase beta chain
MKIPVSWLKEYVDFEDSTQGLSDRLTFSGIEVESVRIVGGGLDEIVAAAVRSVAPHPNADRLTVCRVFDGREETEVVCGAPNVREGGLYPLARVGHALPDGTKLKKAKIRGVESRGMLCAEDELGLSDDHAGLLELPPDAAPGTLLPEILGPPETVFDLEITPNRPDCLSVIGVAREVAALYGARLKRPDVHVPERGDPVHAMAAIEVREPVLCPRYTARGLRGAAFGPSPAWMRKRLRLCGIRPISAAVDVTNYVLLESGHPLHAFDLDRLAERRVIVRRAAEGESIVTLDDQTRPLTPDMLVIADADRPVAVAGVMGGAGSEIRAETRTILLESACFDPASIRSTSKALGLSTESSYRFARGTDAENADWASRRATALLVSVAGAEAAPGALDAYPSPRGPIRIECRPERVNRLLGVDWSAEDMKARLQSLELDVRGGGDGGAFEVFVPSHRSDLEREVDCIEEIARLNGLDRIPAPHPRAEASVDVERGPFEDRSALRAALRGLGLREIMNYSLTSELLLDRVDPEHRGRRIRLPHPLSADQSVLRTSLLPQMLDTLGRNRARQNPCAALFEFGAAYLAPAREGDLRERDRVAIGLTGPVGRPAMEARREIDDQEMFLWLKGILEALLAGLRAPAPSFEPLDAHAFAPHRGVTVRLEGEPVGCLGLVRPSVREAWRIGEPAAVAELDCGPLTRRLDARPRMEAPAAFPSIERDMALIVDESVTHREVVEVIRNAAPKDLEHISLFDLFRGGHVGEGRKSMAYACTYRSAARTLTDEEANAYHDEVKEALKKMLKAEFRG